jgi:hypothetical protein
MTERILAAQEFVGAFEFLSRRVGRAAALLDPRVQAARRRYLAECAA